MKTKYYRCNVCGKIVAVVNDTKGELTCCNKPMEEITKKEVDDKLLNDKHIPTYKRTKNKVVVQVGSELHPSSKEHHIEWVSLITNKGFQVKTVDRDESPVVTFRVDEDEQIEEITSYCNIHSLYTLCVVKDDCGCDITF